MLLCCCRYDLTTLKTTYSVQAFPSLFGHMAGAKATPWGHFPYLRPALRTCLGMARPIHSAAVLKSEEGVILNPYSVWKPSQAEIRNAQKVFTAQNREFIAAATSLQAMLPPSLPEVYG